MVNAFNEDWITKWQLNGFRNANKKAVQNVELWQRLIEFNNIHKIMESLDLEIEKACELLGISVEEYELMRKSIHDEGKI